MQGPVFLPAVAAVVQVPPHERHRGGGVKPDKLVTYLMRRGASGRVFRGLRGSAPCRIFFYLSSSAALFEVRRLAGAESYAAPSGLYSGASLIISLAEGPSASMRFLSRFLASRSSLKSAPVYVQPVDCFFERYPLEHDRDHRPTLIFGEFFVYRSSQLSPDFP